MISDEIQNIANRKMKDHARSTATENADLQFPSIPDF